MRNAFHFATVLLAAAVLLAGLPGAYASPIALDLFPVSPMTVTTAPATISISVSGLGGYTSPALGAFDFTLQYDPTLLSLASLVFGDPVLGDLLDPAGCGFACQQIAFPGPGLLQIGEASPITDIPAFVASQPASFTLARIMFNSRLASGSRTTSLKLTVNRLSDEVGNDLSYTIPNQPLGPGPGPGPGPSVPEPSTILLAAGGLLGLLLGRRRRA